jgi:hypothetical protein
MVKAKRAGGLTQVIEPLLSKYKALSSNSSTAKKKKKKSKMFSYTLLAHKWYLALLPSPGDGAARRPSPM